MLHIMSNGASQTDDVVLGKRSSEEANNAGGDVVAPPPPPSSVATISNEHVRNSEAQVAACSAHVAEGILRLTIENVRSMTDTVRSEPNVINNVPWKIMVMPRQHTVTKKSTQRCLGFFLQCCPNSYNDSWSCQASAELRMLSQKPGVSNFVRKTTHEYTSKENDWGYSCFMTWADILDENQGYILKGTIILEVLVRAEPPKGILSHEAFIKKIEEYIRLAEVQSSRGLIDKAIEVNMSASKFCKDKDVSVKGKLEEQRVSLIKVKLHQSIERIEKCGKNPKDSNDFHTLNSLRHALVGNMCNNLQQKRPSSTCTKNGHHKGGGTYKDKTGAVHTLHHTCHLSNDGKCKVRHVKKTMTMPLCKNKGVSANDQELSEALKRDAAEFQKIARWSEAMDDVERMHVKDVVENMLDRLCDVDSQMTVDNNGFVDEEFECNMNCDGNHPYGCTGFEETLECEDCGACYTETLANLCPELQDQLPVHFMHSQTPLVKTRRSSVRMTATTTTTTTTTATSVQQLQPISLQGIDNMVLNLDKAMKVSAKYTNRLCVQEVMEYFKEEFNNKSGSIRDALGRVGVSANYIEEATAQLQNGPTTGEPAADQQQRSASKSSSETPPPLASKQQRNGAADPKAAANNNKDSSSADSASSQRKQGRQTAGNNNGKKGGQQPPTVSAVSTEPGQKDQAAANQENLVALKAFLKHADQERAELMEQCKRLEKLNDQLHASMTSQNGKLEKVNQMLKERRAEIKKLEKRVKQDSSLAVDNANLAKKLEATEAELRDVRAKADDSRRRLTDDNRRLQETKKAMQKELNSASSELDRLQCLLDDKQAALNSLEKERVRDKLNQQNALKEATERAKRAEVVILELRLEYGMRLLLRAYEDCQAHLSQFDELYRKHAAAISPADMKTLTALQQDWMKVKASISEMMQKSKADFHQQIEAVNSGKMLSSLPMLEVPKPPPQPGLPRLCMASRSTPPQHRPSVGQVQPQPICRPAVVPTSTTPIGSVKSTSGSSGGSLSPSKPTAEVRYDNGGPCPATSSYAVAAAVADRSYQCANQSLQRPVSVQTGGGGGGLLQQFSPGGQHRTLADVQQPQPWLNGKAFGTLFDSFGYTNSGGAGVAAVDSTSPNMFGQQWSWTTTNNGGGGANCVQPAPGVSPVQSVSDYSSTPNSTRPPSRGPSRCSPLFPKWTDHIGGGGADVDPLVARIMASFPTLTVDETQCMLEDYRLMQANKSLKTLSLDNILTHVNKQLAVKKDKIGGGDHKQHCVLCKRNFKNNSSQTLLVCQHRFHTNCIQKWFLQKKCCPTCAMSGPSQDDNPALN